MQRRRYLMRYISEDEPAGVIQFSALLDVRFWHEADKMARLKVCCERKAEVRICRNNRVLGLSLASDNQQGEEQVTVSQKISSGSENCRMLTKMILEKFCIIW